MKLALALVLSLTAAAATASPPSPACRAADALDPATRFLDAYAAGDRTAVEAALAPEIVAYGSDSSEFEHGRAEVMRIFDLDHRLWGGSARFGPLRDVSASGDCSHATVMFMRDFAVGDRPPVPVRFAMTWRKRGDAWRLLQTANAVPTTGQSAAELLGASR